MQINLGLRYLQKPLGYDKLQLSFAPCLGIVHFA